MAKFSDIDLNCVEGVLLDIDDTLYSYLPCHVAALESCWSLFDKLYPQQLSENDFQEIYTRKRDQIKKRMPLSGTCRSRLLAFKDMLEELQLRKGLENAVLLTDCYWNSLVEKMELFAEAKTFLEQCRAKKIKVCLVTDMLTRVQIQKIVKLGIQDYIDALVTSEEVGVEKPNKKIFNFALEKLRLSPNQVIMVGDSYEKDILGAKALGIKAYQV